MVMITLLIYLGRLIQIRRIILLILLFIISLSACASSEKDSNVNDANSIFDQVLKNRESGGDSEGSTNNSQNISEADKDSSTVNNDNASSSTISSWKDLEQLGPYGPENRTYDEIKEQYPGKTILTVAGVSPSDFITDSINNYLFENGTEYVVFFPEFTLEYSNAFANINEYDSKQYDEKKQEVLNIIDTVDIIPINRKMFYEFARNGCFEPWSSYLSTVEGMKLYQSLPKNNWKTCDVDGEKYGINGRSDLVFGPPSYIVNKDIMNKYNLTEEDLNKPIYELEAILKMVADGEKANTGFRPIALDYAEWFNVLNSSVYLNSKAVALYNDTTKKAGSVLDESENLRWLEALCQYANQGLINNVSKRLNNFFIKINMRASLPYMIPDYMFLYNKEGELADTHDVTEIVLDKYYDGCLSWISLTSMYANCIPVSSKHKDEAFDFLMKLYTDPYLTNLLTYGIENKTYIMKDGKVEWPDIYYLGYGNTYISYPRNYEYADKNERYWKLNEELPYVYYDFVFDPANVNEELEKTNQVMEKVSDILSGNVTDFDTFITDIRKQLDESGLLKLLEEVNRQRDEWINSKKVAKEELE